MGIEFTEEAVTVTNAETDEVVDRPDIAEMGRSVINKALDQAGVEAVDVSDTPEDKQPKTEEEIDAEALIIASTMISSSLREDDPAIIRDGRGFDYRDDENFKS